ncbi:MAG: hypothetical protein B7Y88_13795 [Sphingomonadales bacterium 32-64-17]|nr:MAG: hypothetical protein B7Y88_13795 [Sphingomonadales bacterium 32-64-17]
MAQASSKPVRERTKGEQLLAEMEAFVRRNPPMTLSKLGREACDNSQLAPRLQNGLNPQDITCRRVRSWMEKNGR